jgi:hypothetical protein
VVMVRTKVTSSCQVALELGDDGVASLAHRSYFENVVVPGYRALPGRSGFIIRHYKPNALVIFMSDDPRGADRSIVCECMLGERGRFPLFPGVVTPIREGVTNVSCTNSICNARGALLLWFLVASGCTVAV